MEKYRAIVLGATGGVGEHLVKKLLLSIQCEKVTVISRRALPLHAKLSVEVCSDFSTIISSQPDRLAALFSDNDIVFCCLGAPEKAFIGLFYNPSKYAKLFQQVDYEYVVGFAKVASAVNVSCFSVVSSPGADPRSRFTFLRIKGEMERELNFLEFNSLSIFRPGSLIKPPSDRDGRMKSVVKKVVAWISSMVPGDSILVEDVATAMLSEFEGSASRIKEGTVVYQAEELRGLSL